jgi:hypothetical protein
MNSIIKIVSRLVGMHGKTHCLGMPHILYVREARNIRRRMWEYYGESWGQENEFFAKRLNIKKCSLNREYLDRIFKLDYYLTS